MLRLRRAGSNHWPLGYEPSELPLLHSAMCCLTRIRTSTGRTKICSATITPWGNRLVCDCKGNAFFWITKGFIKKISQKRDFFINRRIDESVNRLIGESLCEVNAETKFTLAMLTVAIKREQKQCGHWACRSAQHWLCRVAKEILKCPNWIDYSVYIGGFFPSVNNTSTSSATDIESPPHRLTASPIHRLVNKINVFSKFLLLLWQIINIC